MENEYPKALFREGSEIEWEGLSLDMTVVNDAKEEALAVADGWAPAGNEPKAKRQARRAADEG